VSTGPVSGRKTKTRRDPTGRRLSSAHSIGSALQHATLVGDLILDLVTAPAARAVRDRGNRASRA
jgi:hypothetical protein